MIAFNGELIKRKGIFEPLNKYVRDCDDGDIEDLEI